MPKSYPNCLALPYRSNSIFKSACPKYARKAAVSARGARLTVTWWTHSIKGLHKNDFIMAAKTDQLL